MTLRDLILTDLQRNGAGSAGEVARRVGSKRQPVRRVLDTLAGAGVVVTADMPLVRMAQCRGTVVRRQRVRMYMLVVADKGSVQEVLQEVLQAGWTV